MLKDICKIEDSLAIARKKFPGQRVSLDALANRFEISGYDRTFHGALLDANILADVYMSLTGGQSKFKFVSNEGQIDSNGDTKHNNFSKEDLNLVTIESSKSDLDAHEARLIDIEKRNSIETIWRKIH